MVSRDLTFIRICGHRCCLWLSTFNIRNVCCDVSVHTATTEYLRCVCGIGQSYEFISIVIHKHKMGTNTHVQRVSNAYRLSLFSPFNRFVHSMYEAAFVFVSVGYTTLRYATLLYDIVYTFVLFIVRYNKHTHTHTAIQMRVRIHIWIHK